ncbi:MAG: S8 family serine peptidase [Planctomycetota bacterium]|nr:S8 family serine peptidase [Planctomycetota bacterium]
MGMGMGSCAACDREYDLRVLRSARDLDLVVADGLREHARDLGDEDTVCPVCVGACVGDDGFHDRIQASWPLDAEAVYGVLPVPLRLHANPHYRGRGVCIAFLDSGFHAHPDLVARRNRIRAYVDATTPDIVEHPSVEPAGALSWHGLMTTSVAAGDGSCSGGRYRALASEADLVLVKISDPDGGVHDEDIARGLSWVRRNHRRLGIRVVNLSVGGDEEQSLRESAVDQLVTALVREGVTVVAAAGNAGKRRLVPPASAPAAITVGGLDDQNLMGPAAYRIWNSNYGPTVDGVGKPELVAPSIWVAAPILPGTDQEPQAEALDRLANASAAEVAGLFRRLGEVAGLHSGFGRRRPEVIASAARRLQIKQQYLEAAYKRVEGTSFAAPIVSSTAAVMLEANPGLTPHRLKRILLDTAELVPGVEPERQGRGVVDPREAVARALRDPGGVLKGLPLSPTPSDGGVRVIFAPRDRGAVAVVGDFNDWDPAAHPLRSLRSGVVVADIASVPDGSRYQLLLEDGALVEDPENPRRVPDGFGEWASRF